MSIEPENDENNNTADLFSIKDNYEKNLDNLDSESNLVKDEQNDCFNTGHWDDFEHQKFIEGIFLFGNNWRLIQNYVVTRSSAQSRSHAQKFLVRLRKKTTLPNNEKITVKNLYTIPPNTLLQCLLQESKSYNSENNKKLLSIIEKMIEKAKLNKGIIPREVTEQMVNDTQIKNQFISRKSRPLQDLITETLLNEKKISKKIFIIKKIKKKKNDTMLDDTQENIKKPEDNVKKETTSASGQFYPVIRKERSDVCCYDQIKKILEEEKGVILENKCFKPLVDIDYFEELDVREYQELSTYVSAYTIKNYKSPALVPQPYITQNIVHNYTFNTYSNPLIIHNPTIPSFVNKDDTLLNTDLDFRGLINHNINNTATVDGFDFKNIMNTTENYAHTHDENVLDHTFVNRHEHFNGL